MFEATQPHRQSSNFMPAIAIAVVVISAIGGIVYAQDLGYITQAGARSAFKILAFVVTGAIAVAAKGVGGE